MHIKYFQSLADIKNHLQEILDRFEILESHSREPEGAIIYAKGLLTTWFVDPDKDYQNIVEELEAIKYLLACRIG